MNAEAVILKAKAIYVEMTEVEKEKKMHEARTKELKGRIEGMESEIRQLVNGVDPSQTEMPLDVPALGPFACVGGGMHDWERFRDDEDTAIESCERCDGERTLNKKGDDPDLWVYVFPQAECRVTMEAGAGLPGVMETTVTTEPETAEESTVH